MKIVISGGRTGFLGRPLKDALVGDGHTVVLLSRQKGTGDSKVRQVEWHPDGSTGSWASDIDGADAVVNLAGESIAGHRWSAAHKQRVLDSRRLVTKSIVAAIAEAAAPPSVLVSGSAVGYYGPLDDRIVTEDTPAGRDFLANVCVAWEAEAMKATGRTRVVCVRTGLALERDGGALPPMLPPFWFGAGGPVGSGRQYWPWIHRQDWIDLVRFALTNDAVEGPLNATGPQPVTNREFAKALGRAMHRPAFMPAPAFALKAILGEMAEALILAGQRVVPEKALRLGFAFRYHTVDAALNDLFQRRRIT